MSYVIIVLLIHVSSGGCCGMGDDTVGNPRRAQISRFELFELVFLLKLNTNSPPSITSRQKCLSQQYPPHSYYGALLMAKCLALLMDMQIICLTIAKTITHKQTITIKTHKHIALFMVQGHGADRPRRRQPAEAHAYIIHSTYYIRIYVNVIHVYSISCCIIV